MLAQLHPPALQLLSRHPAVQAARLAPDTPGPHLLHLRGERDLCAPLNITAFRIRLLGNSRIFVAKSTQNQ